MKKIQIMSTFFKFWKDNNTTLNLLINISRSTIFSIWTIKWQKCKYTPIFLWVVDIYIVNFDYLINHQIVNFFGGVAHFKNGE